MKRRNFSGLVVFALLAILVTLPNAEAKTTVGGHLASPSWELFQKAMSYVAHKDHEALKKLLDSGLVIELRSGIEVEIVDTKIFSGAIKIRPREKTIELWTNLEAVK